MVRSLEGKGCEERQMCLSVLSAEQSGLRGGLTAAPEGQWA